jgi:hypothetical protein
MKETGKGGDHSFIPHNQAAERPEPRERGLDDPPPPISPQLATILLGRVVMVPLHRDDELNAPVGRRSLRRSCRASC